MVNNSTSVDAIFSALADATRRGILVRLSRRGECPVTMLARPFRISPPAISRHLRVLERARLIERRRSGRIHYIRVRSAAIKQAQSWLAQCAAAWDFQLDSLEAFLQSEEQQTPKSKPQRRQRKDPQR